MKIENIDVFGPMVADYSLNQCVAVKAQIKRYRNQCANIYGLVVFGLLSIWGLIAGAVWVLDWAGVITYIEDVERDLIVPFLIWGFVCMITSSKMWAYDNLTTSINKRIDVLGGLQDGKKGEE